MAANLLKARHSRLTPLFEAWQTRGGNAPTSGDAILDEIGDAADAVVVIAPRHQPAGSLTITRSGADVDALYAAALMGDGASGLTPGSDLGEAEARSALDTGRPLLVEDQVELPDGRRRVARLYLPLSAAEGATSTVLCGVIALG